MWILAHVTQVIFYILECLKLKLIYFISGCITNENCADPLECYVDHECKEPPSFLSLKQIIFDTATCDNCQGTNEEDGPKLQIIGGEGKDGTPMCDTEGLDHADRVDFATGTIAVFDDKDDKDVLGTCYRVRQNQPHVRKQGKTVWYIK